MSLSAPSHASRVKHFGLPDWRWSGSLANPEAVTLDPAWSSANVVKALLPGMTKPIWLHREAVQPFTLWLLACTENGLRGNLVAFDGSFVPRFVRQTGTLHERLAKCRALGEAKASHRLSNHTLATAVDFDAARYPLGKPCPPGDPRWHVAELAATFGITGAATTRGGRTATISSWSSRGDHSALEPLPVLRRQNARQRGARAGLRRSDVGRSCARVPEPRGFREVAGFYSRPRRAGTRMVAAFDIRRSRSKPPARVGLASAEVVGWSPAPGTRKWIKV